MNKRKLLFSTFERDGLTYVNPLPACHSACMWRDVLAKMGRCIDRMLVLAAKGAPWTNSWFPLSAGSRSHQPTPVTLRSNRKAAGLFPSERPSMGTFSIRLWSPLRTFGEARKPYVDAYRLLPTSMYTGETTLAYHDEEAIRAGQRDRGEGQRRPQPARPGGAFTAGGL